MTKINWMLVCNKTRKLFHVGQETTAYFGKKVIIENWAGPLAFDTYGVVVIRLENGKLITIDPCLIDARVVNANGCVHR